MRLPFRIFLIATSLVLLVIPKKIAWGCIEDIDPDEAMFLLFQQKLPTPGLEDFYLTAHWFTPGHGNSDRIRNCKEWVAYTGNKVKPKDVYEVQYHLSASAFLYGCNTGEWGSVADNSFVQWLKQPANRPALDYMALAKKAEMHNAADADPWATGYYFGNDYHDPHVSDSLAGVALSKCESGLPAFLTERYAFQVLKALHYGSLGYVSTGDTISGNAPQRIAVYKKFLEGNGSVVAAWGMLYYALAIGDVQQRNLYLLKAFDLSDEKRIFVSRALGTDDIVKLQPLLRDPPLKAAALAFSAIKTPGRSLRYMQQLYGIDPRSKYLPLLISREVNKIEEWLLSPEVRGYQYGNAKDRDRAYLVSVRQFLETMAGATSEKDYVKLAVIRLCHIEHNFALAASYLNSMHRLSDPLLETQRQVEEAVSTMYTADISQPATQATLNTIFISLERLGISDKPEALQWYGDWVHYSQAGTLLSRLYLLLSTRYREVGDIVNADLLFQKASIPVNAYYGRGFSGDNYYNSISYLDKFASPAHIDSLMRFTGKARKTAFEQRICSGMEPDTQRYAELKGTILLRQGKFEEAAAVFNRLPDDYWQTTYEFKNYLKRSSVSTVYIPRTSESDKYFPVNRPAYQYAGKKQILADITDLQHQLAHAVTDSQKAALSFLLGNSFFNLTYWGKDWMAFSYGKSSSELYDDADNDFSYSFYPNNVRYRDIYFGGKWAKEMYRNALLYTHNNKELTAACMLMLSYFDYRREEMRFKRGPHKYGDRPKGYVSPYVAALRKNFAHTDVFEMSSTECPDIGGTVVY